MQKLSNHLLEVALSPHGAELKRFYHKGNKQEWLWGGDEKFWPRSSPVLFPIVGKLKDNAYTYKGNRYELPQHGFARDMDFAIIEESERHVTYRLESDYQTLEKYPFVFQLDVTYRLADACLEVEYRVANPAREALWFSIGAHPGFSCLPSKDADDVKAQIRLDIGRELLIHRLQGGLLAKEATEGLVSSFEGIIELTDHLIEHDAMVFKSPLGRWVDLHVPRRPGFVRLIAKGWPYYGIWSKPNAPFVCLEPWYGVADSVDTTGDITQKEGIMKLGPGQEWQAMWSVEVKK